MRSWFRSIRSSILADVGLHLIITWNRHTIASCVGLVYRLLQEILATRVMIKDSMKLHKSDRKLQRILDARQLGLKLIANVTYGYTAAHFSGRMPCVEVHTVLDCYNNIGNYCVNSFLVLSYLTRAFNSPCMH